MLKQKSASSLTSSPNTTAPNSSLPSHLPLIYSISPPSSLSPSNSSLLPGDAHGARDVTAPPWRDRGRGGGGDPGWPAWGRAVRVGHTAAPLGSHGGGTPSMGGRYDGLCKWRWPKQSIFFTYFWLMCSSCFEQNYKKASIRSSEGLLPVKIG